MEDEIFLAGLAGLGVPTSTLSLMTEESVAEATDDPDKNVPYVSEVRIKDHDPELEAAPDEPLSTEPVVDTVSRDRWRLIESAVNASQRAQQIVDQHFNNTSAVVHSDSPTDHRVEVRIHKKGTSKDDSAEGAPSKEAVRKKIPEQIKGVAGEQTKHESKRAVPVSVSSVTIEPTSKYSSKYRPVPAGAQQEAFPDYSTSGAISTTCAPFYNNGADERQLLTAGHSFEINGDTASNVHQPNKKYFSESRVGSLYEKKHTYDTDSDGNLIEIHFDAGVWSPESDIDTKMQLAKDGGGYRMDVTGIVTWSSIKYHSGDQSFTVKKQGRSSGVTEGYISSIDKTDRRFVATPSVTGGDSGGPVYREDAAETALIMGPVSAGLGDGGLAANDIEHVMDTLNLSL